MKRRRDPRTVCRSIPFLRLSLTAHYRLLTPNEGGWITVKSLQYIKVIRFTLQVRGAGRLCLRQFSLAQLDGFLPFRSALQAGAENVDHAGENNRNRQSDRYIKKHGENVGGPAAKCGAEANWNVLNIRTSEWKPSEIEISTFADDKEMTRADTTHTMRTVLSRQTAVQKTFLHGERPLLSNGK